MECLSNYRMLSLKLCSRARHRKTTAILRSTTDETAVDSFTIMRCMLFMLNAIVKFAKSN